MLAGLRVLLVEDEAILLMTFEQLLEDMGCVVVGTAARLEDALAKCRSLELDVALLDVNLAGKTSFPVAEELRARGVPVVFSTGYGAAALPEDMQGTPVLVKPFQQADLAKALRLACDR